MAVKTLNFVRFEPSLWGEVMDPSQSVTKVLDAFESAPDGVDRNQLRTRVNLHPLSPHSAFAALTAIHDIVVPIRGAYAPLEGGDDDPDTLQDRLLVRPKDYNIFEFRSRAGQIYANMPISYIKRMSFRQRQTLTEDGESGATLSVRLVNLPNLENALKQTTALSVKVVGYRLERVLLSTPITRLDVLAEEIESNTEMQDAKGKAERMRFLIIDVVTESALIRVRVAENGAVNFPDYPGDGIALDVLESLEPIIDKQSGTMLT